jgi:hypothetical protein
MKYLKSYGVFEAKGDLKAESSSNMGIVEDILLPLRDEGKCKFEPKENIIYAVIDNESDFREVEKIIDEYGISYCFEKPHEKSEWRKKNFRDDPDVLETTKWRLLVWDDVIEGVFKSWLDRAKYKLEDEDSRNNDSLCEKPGDPKSWLFTITKKELWDSTNFLSIRSDLWYDEMRDRFGLSNSAMNMLMRNLCFKYLIPPGQDPKNWIIKFEYTNEFKDSFGRSMGLD